MAQPIFLRNFTLDGVDIGELFVVGTVTMPFMNVERGYYQVGNTNGEHLLYTRLGSNSITVNGHLIKDHTGLSVSETKDLLVSQLMSEGTMRMVFDGQPDRYYNVVFEGVQEYDATDLDFTPLTLTFTCPEGVAHSIKDDTWINVAPNLDLADNWLADSDFETKLVWNKEHIYVTERVVNNSKVAGMDFTDKSITEMDELENNYLADDYWFEFDEGLAVGQQAYIGATYGTPTTLFQQTGNESDKNTTLALRIEAYDKQNGKLLETFEKNLPDVPIVNKAYAYNSTGTDRFTHFQPQPNLFQDGVASERPLITSNQGTVWTRTEGQTVIEWGATNAVRYVSSGGTSRIKGTINSRLLTSDSREYVHSIYVKNNAGTAVEIDNNLGQIITLQPKESRRLEFNPAVRADDLTPTALRFTVRIPNTAPLEQVLDITVWRAKIEVNKYGFATEWTDGDILGASSVDNTTAPYVGYSATDTWQEGTNYNLLKTASLLSNTTNWFVRSEVDALTVSSLGTHTKLTKSTVTSGRPTFNQDTSAVVTSGQTYTLSGEIYVQASGLSGMTNDTQLAMRVTYNDDTIQDVIAPIDLTKRDQWQTVSGTATLQNKPVKRCNTFLAFTANGVGTLNVRNFKLETGSARTPWYPTQTEVGASYTWVPNGTSSVDVYAPLVTDSLRATITKEGVKAIRIRIVQRGNTRTLLSAPRIKFGANPTWTYQQTRKQWKSVIEVDNNGTTTAYPVFEITNKNESGMIGIINDEGGVLQFGNGGNVDQSPPAGNQYGYFMNWAVTRKPANVVVNSGHISQYPNIYDDVNKPNKVLGDFDYSKGDVVRPKWSSTYAQGAWSGPTMSIPVATPAGGDKTGAFEVYELLTFASDNARRGRYEISVITTGNEILMSGTLRDSYTTSNERTFECWLGTRLIKTLSIDGSKTQGGWFRVTMTRDKTGKRFTWKLENIVMENVNGRPQQVTKAVVSHTYNVPVAIKSSVDRVSRWLLRYDSGKGTAKQATGIKLKMRTKDVLNVRTGTTTASRSQGTVAKNLTFDTTVPQKGQSVYGNRDWYYITKGTGVPASGWVSGYYLTQVSRDYTYKTVEVDATSIMEINDTIFTWLADDNPVETKNPFKAGDEIVVDTFEKRIYVNGSEREELSALGNQWNTFALGTGSHQFRLVNADWDSNTMEVKVRLNRRYH